MSCCVHCGRERDAKSPPGFRETCPECDSYLHSCLNCRLYNRRGGVCSSVTAECAGLREHYNYCEEYQIAEIRLPVEKPKNDHDPKSKWQALFDED